MFRVSSSYFRRFKGSSKVLFSANSCLFSSKERSFLKHDNNIRKQLNRPKLHQKCPFPHVAKPFVNKLRNCKSPTNFLKILGQTNEISVYRYSLSFIKNKFVKNVDDIDRKKFDFLLAIDIFKLAQKNNVVLDGAFFNSLLNILVYSDKPHLAMNYVKIMKDEYGIIPTNITYNIILTGIQYQPLLYKHLILDICDIVENNKCEVVGDNIIIYSTLIRCLFHCNELNKAQLLYNSVIHHPEYKINNTLIGSMMTGYANLGWLDKMHQILDEASNDSSFVIDNGIYFITLTGYLKSNKCLEGLKLLNSYDPKIQNDPIAV